MRRPTLAEISALARAIEPQLRGRTGYHWCHEPIPTVIISHCLSRIKLGVKIAIPARWMRTIGLCSHVTAIKTSRTLERDGWIIRRKSRWHGDIAMYEPLPKLTDLYAKLKWERISVQENVKKG